MVMSKNNKKYDIIIIGGGIAGLYFLYTLLNDNNNSNDSNDSNKNILLLEGSNRFGGRVKTIKGRNKSYEAGAGRFSDKHKLLIELLHKFNIDNRIPIPSTQKYINTNDETNNIKSVEDTFDLDYIKDVDNILNKIIKLYDNNKLKEQKNGLKVSNFNLLEIVENNLNKKSRTTLYEKFPYYSELCVMNALDAINSFKNDFNSSIQYYILKGGLEQVIKKLLDFIKVSSKSNSNNITLKLNSNVNSVISNNADNSYTVCTQDFNYNATKVVFAIDQKRLINMKLFNKSELKILKNSINYQPLIRVYAKYKKQKINGVKKVWFSGLNKIVTNEPIKYIIPINEDAGTIMISYTDGKHCEKIYESYINNTLNELISTSLHNLFPETKIPEPIYLEVYYFNVGCHYWTKGHYSNDYYNTIQNIRENVYIIGEAYSTHQAWIEGALQSSLDVYNNYFKSSGIIIGGHNNYKKIISSNKKLKEYSLKYVKQHNSVDDGLLVVDNFVYKIPKQWTNIDHPGGPIIKKYLGSDVSEVFHSMHKTLGKHPYDMLEKFKIGKLK